jgi:hypothetical protein
MSIRPSLFPRAQFESVARDFRAGRLSLAEFANRFYATSDSRGQETTEIPRGGQSVCLDADRVARCGFPEVIFGQGKTYDAICQAIDGLTRHGQAALVTRLPAEFSADLASRYTGARYHAEATTFAVGRCEPIAEARVAVVTAGTCDYAVAAESAETLRWMGIDPIVIQDVGVAGPQRLPPHLARLAACHAVVVVAGFEGALPSVVGGHVDCPVIGVPSSAGGTGLWPGFVPLMAMLNSCAPNVTVVNIDGGFKAGYLAGLIARAATRPRFEPKELIPRQAVTS